MCTCVINSSAFCLLHGPAFLVKPGHHDNDDDDDNVEVGKDDDNEDNDGGDHLGKDDDDDGEAGGVTDYNPYKVFQQEGSNG